MEPHGWVLVILFWTGVKDQWAVGDFKRAKGCWERVELILDKPKQTAWLGTCMRWTEVKEKYPQIKWVSDT